MVFSECGTQHLLCHFFIAEADCGKWGAVVDWTIAICNCTLFPTGYYRMPCMFSSFYISLQEWFLLIWSYCYRLKLFSKGESQRYRGARDLTSLLPFIKETLGLTDCKVLQTWILLYLSSHVFFIFRRMWSVVNLF